MALSPDDNRGPLVNVAMWITLAPTCIATLVKLYTKWAVIQGLQTDDFLILFALVFCLPLFELLTLAVLTAK